MESSTPSRSSSFARFSLAALGAIALLLSAPATRAAAPAAATASGDQGEAKARAEFKRGKTAYDLGRFDEALAAYTSAYEAKPLPAFLFNMAQCHKQMGNWERASFFYKRYLALSPSAKDEAAVKKLVEEADAKAAEAERRKADELKKQEDARTAALIVAPPPPADPLLARPTPGLEPERAAATPIYKTWWFWTGVGVVVAAAAGGTTAAVLSKPQAPATTLGTLNAR
jgi:tetratricopeptide (TPR) repeat protein